MLKDAWTLAIEALSWVQLQRLGERLALAKAARQLQIEDLRAVGLAHKLVFETLRRLNTIDSALTLVLAPRSLTDYSFGIQSFLRLYTYKVLFEAADYNEAAAIARAGRAILGWSELNPVEETLGRILSVRLADVIKAVSDEERVALRTFNPTWFVKYCFKMLGRSETLKFLEGVSKPLPTYLRLNTLKESEENLFRSLEKEGIGLEKQPYLKYTYRFTESRKLLQQTEAFRKGYFYIQDKASCLAVEVADPKSGNIVLDVCAAPGAKTTHMAQLMRNEGTIYSVDYSKRRMNIWRREVRRMGVDNAMAIVADAQKPLPAKLEADLIMLDPPCTSTGAFSKTPSAKWRLTKRSVFNMAAVQWNMLINCAELLRDGGHLVYSTCSVSLEENEMLIEKFLKWNLDFSLIETSPRVGLPGLRGQEECQRLYPHIHRSNGFFVAKLVKRT